MIGDQNGMTTINPSENPKDAAAYDMTAATFDMPKLIAHGNDDRRVVAARLTIAFQIRCKGSVAPV